MFTIYVLIAIKGAGDPGRAWLELCKCVAMVRGESTSLHQC